MPIKPISWSVKFSSDYIWEIIIHILATPMASIGGGQQPNKEEKLLLSLHKERSWSSPYVYLFQEFWCLSTVILVTSLPKSGTTWLKSLIFTTVNQEHFSPTENNHPFKAPTNLANQHQGAYLNPYSDLHLQTLPEAWVWNPGGSFKYMHLLFKVHMQEAIMNIHLMKLPFSSNCNSKKTTHSHRLCYWGEGVSL